MIMLQVSGTNLQTEVPGYSDA